MPLCPSCRQLLPRERRKVGARCPYCRDPLYEPPEASQPAAATADSLCPVHPQNATAGTCQHCGNYLCKVCRTRWQNRLLCPVCVALALEAKEAAPEETRAHVRQALLAMALGLVAWGMSLVGMVIVAIGVQDGPNLMLAGLGTLIFLAGFLPAGVGLGQGAAAVQGRGNYMILATLGLLLSGLHLGVVIGLLCFSLWQR